MSSGKSLSKSILFKTLFAFSAEIFPNASLPSFEERYSSTFSLDSLLPFIRHCIRDKSVALNRSRFINSLIKSSLLTIPLVSHLYSMVNGEISLVATSIEAMFWSIFRTLTSILSFFPVNSFAFWVISCIIHCAACEFWGLLSVSLLIMLLKFSNSMGCFSYASPKLSKSSRMFLNAPSSSLLAFTFAKSSSIKPIIFSLSS